MGGGSYQAGQAELEEPPEPLKRTISHHFPCENQAFSPCVMCSGLQKDRARCPNREADAQQVPMKPPTKGLHRVVRVQVEHRAAEVAHQLAGQ